MSESNVETLRRIVIEDEELVNRLAATTGETALTEELMKIGTEKGLPFTREDLTAWTTGTGASLTLSEEQLNSVAGGRASTYAKYGTSYGNSIWCGFCGSTSGSFM